MGFFEALIAWANLPFTVAMSTVLLYALLQASGLFGVLAGDADHDIDGDGNGDIDHATHVNHDLVGGILSTVGVGRLPTSMIWQTFGMTFGLTGITLNGLVFGVSKDISTWALLLSLPAGLVGGYVMTSACAKLVAKYIKPSQEAPGKRHLVGLAGVIVSGKVDGEFGEVRVKGPHGEFVQLACRVLPGEPSLSNQAAVVIVSYDSDRDCVYVAPTSDSSSVSTRVHS